MASKPPDHEAGDARGESQTDPRSTVLVVDDDPLGRKLTMLRLCDEGYAVAIAGTAEDGLLMAWSTSVAAIISDIRMPGMDGFQLCLALRSHPTTKDIPFILLTSAIVEELDETRARQAGADGLFVRTPDLHEALEALSRLMNR
jgi:CheY-like chemotaxis protein